MAEADTTAPLEAPPERDCYGCGKTDTHPRMFVVVDLSQEAVPYHYDCVPHGLAKTLTVDAGGQAGLDATAAGLRGADVQSAVHAAATKEV